MTVGPGSSVQCTGMNAVGAGGGGNGNGNGGNGAGVRGAGAIGGGGISHVDRLAAGAKRGLIGGGGVVGLGRGSDPEREAVTLLRASSHSASRDSVLHTTITLTPTPTPPPLSN